MKKIAVLAEQQKKTDSKTVDYKVGIKPNGSRLWWHYNLVRHTHTQKPTETAALGARGMVGMTLWLMQQPSSGGKIRGKVAHLQRVIQAALQTFVSQAFNLLPSYQTRLPVSR